MPEAAAVAAETARRSYGKLLAILTARTRDLAAAEDALADAFAAALAHWPREGCPVNPEGWLLTTARRKLIDGARRHQRAEAAMPHLELLAGANGAAAGEIPDERLALLFLCAHPAIDAGIRAPLMLQTVLGLDAAAIASAFLVSPAAMGKRLVRAKEKIREAGIPFRVPGGDELPGRVGAVLEAIYAAYSAGWNDPAGVDAARGELTGEAIFLARLAAALLPGEAEALGLLALMLHTEARRDARRDGAGAYVPFEEQNPALWNAAMIREAESLIQEAARFAAPGRYQIEAAIQSAHVHRRLTGDANWRAVLALYDLLGRVAPSPVVAINRAVVVAEVESAEAGLAALHAECADGRLQEYQPYWAALAELHRRAGNGDEARAAYARAIALERDDVVRRFLQIRQGNLI